MQPLAGVAVVDFTTLLPGPLATLILSEAGAEVIKVEPPAGDPARGARPFDSMGPALFDLLVGRKTCIRLDLKSAEDRVRLQPHLRRADVLVEQFRPGVMERLGLGYEAVRRLNPRIVYCSITGYGQDGPRADKAGHDLNYQAESGLLSLAGSETVPSSLVADVGAGSYAALINVLLALILRERTGEGCRLDIAMADGVLAFAAPALAAARHCGSDHPAVRLLAGASPRYQLYRTRDGRLIAVGALEPKFWSAFCDGIELPAELRDDAKDASGTLAAVRAIIASETAEAWMARLGPRDCCVSLVPSLSEAIGRPAGLPLPLAAAFREQS